MNKIAAITAVAALSLIGSSARIGWTQEDKKTKTTTQTTTTTSETTDANAVDAAHTDAPAFIQKWPDASRTIAAAMVEKYGQPDEFTQERLSWSERSPFKRIVVYRFPTHHYDMLEQTVDYVYPEKNWSQESPSQRIILGETVVVPNIEKFEMASLSNSEDNNILALNLANDVVQGRKSPKEAREEYSRTAMRSLSGKSSSSVEHLNFTPRKPSAQESERLKLHGPDLAD